MKKIRLFETFAGIGAQTKALNNISKNLGIEVDNVGISEWYVDSIIAYSKIHHKKEFDKELKSITLDKKSILEKFSINPSYCFSTDSKKPSTLKSIKEDKLKELFVANKVSKNFGSITELKGSELPQNIDIFTYSFPCTDISLQGKQGGLLKTSETASSLVWQVLRVLEEAKEHNNLPKTLLMENVKALFSKKFIKNWEEVKEILSQFGYNTYDTTINAIDKGSIQRRERVFAVSVRKDIDKGFKYNDSDHKKSNLKLKDILEKNVGEDFIVNKLKQHINGQESDLKATGLKYLVLQGYTTFQSENILYDIEGNAPTITASGANSRVKIIDNNGDLRYLMPIELWQLMGFDKKDYLAIGNVSKATASRLAGNSISVQALEDIFEDVIKQVL